ncbi:MAG: HEAT repeat domain-containing protein [Planctomycetes bacterium]|nr:HEAT repeat domain-containing protein [Planctomycetota bacterium]MCP4838101.1 HEAT repeat domain-containing protein [Planctomycetota bacterium]
MKAVLLIGTMIAGALLPFGCVMDDLDDIGQMFEAPTPGQAARWALDQHDPDRRRQGLVLLSTATFGGAEVYVSLYRDYVENDSDPLVKATAITALARHGTSEDAILIAPWADRRVSSSETVRWAAAKGLQRLHNTDVVPTLIAVALDRDEQGEVRSAACVAMGQYPEDRVMQALIAALDARSLAVNADAAESLALLTGKRFGMDITVWENWYEAAQASGEPFSGQLEYLYPTYSRDSAWWEHIAFWLDEQHEPALRPIGLREVDEQSTWDDFGPSGGQHERVDDG